MLNAVMDGVLKVVVRLFCVALHLLAPHYFFSREESLMSSKLTKCISFMEQKISVKQSCRVGETT